MDYRKPFSSCSRSHCLLFQTARNHYFLLLPALFCSLALFGLFHHQEPVTRAVDGFAAQERQSTSLGSAQEIVDRQNSKPKTLQGAAALTELKKGGQYQSLQAAIHNALYGFKVTDGKNGQASKDSVDTAYRVDNPRHQFTAGFDGRGVQVKTMRGDALRLQWLSVGREGAKEQPLNAGQVALRGEELQLRRAGATEWFRNGEAGLEQGFILHQRPEGDGTEVRLALGTSGLNAQNAPNVKNLIHLVDGKGQTALTYSKLKVWDANGKVLPARMEAKNGRILLAMRDEGARYPLTVDPVIGAQQAYLKAFNTIDTKFAAFGQSVSISGDTAVVGANVASGTSTGEPATTYESSMAGAAYVFVRNGNLWSQQAHLKASNAGRADWFGYSVCIDGDTIVVGAPLEASNADGVNGDQSDNSAQQAGAAYVFVRNGTTWSQQAYLKASNSDGGDAFGWSVAIDVDTVVAGAIQESGSSSGVNGDQSATAPAHYATGAAYVFTRSGGLSGTWSQQAYLKASNNGYFAPNNNFGWSVAIDGDTAVVGALNEKTNSTGVNGNQSAFTNDDYGAAYVFVRSGGLLGTWSQQAYLKASNAGADDYFGSSVAISRDTIVVGASGESSNATGVNGDQSNNSFPDNGAAYVFVRRGSTWSQQAYLKASPFGRYFGGSAAIDGDTIVIGATNRGSYGTAFVFTRIGVTWSQQAALRGSNTEGDDLFGSSVSLSGDTVVVGAPSEDSNATGINGNENDNSAENAGAAYVFTGLGVAPSLSIDDVSVTEANGGSTQATFTISLSAPTSKTVSVTVQSGSTGGSPVATPGTNYTPLSPTTITFAPGQMMRTVSISIKGDTADESDEKFGVTLSGATNAYIGDNVGVGTILDNDEPPIISVSAPNVTEGDSDSVTMTFTLKLSAASERNVSVQYKTANASAFPATAGSDYVAAPLTTVIFLAGETTKTVNVTVNGDLLDEANERVALALTNPVNATVGTVADGIIVDNDATPSLSINDVQITEGNSGTTLMSFTVTLSTPSGQTVTVNAATGGGGSPAATAGTDYLALAPASITFAPGQTNKQVSVTIYGDTNVEQNEKLGVILSGAVNATLADNSGIGTILNDDAAGAPALTTPPNKAPSGDDLDTDEAVE